MSIRSKAAKPLRFSARDNQLLAELKQERLPKHVAIIMDGNGRWAKKRSLPRIQGHFRGAGIISDIAQLCSDLGITHLTLYAFSEENWNRPKAEISALMTLLNLYLKKEMRKFMENGVQLRTIGNADRLPERARKALDKTIEATSGNHGMTLTLALSYSGRDELTRAVRAIAAEHLAGGADPAAINAEMISRHLDTSGYPDPDLLIRTSGESRLSNFMLWQLAYTEIYLTPTLWPDFSITEMLEALVDFQGRGRRFGGIVDHKGPSKTLSKARDL